MRHLVFLSALAALVSILWGCAASRATDPFAPSPGANASEIRHIVLVSLVQPSDADELIAEMDRLLQPIPGITRYWRGSRASNDRPEVTHDYDVGLVIDFADSASYDAYVIDPRHVEIVSAWKPRCTSLRIFDVLPQAAPELTR